MPHRVIKSIDGRRGGALTIVASAFLALGWSQLRPRPDGRSPVLSWLPDWFGNDELGMCVIALSAVVLLCALISKRSKYALVVGYQVMMFTTALLAALYGSAAIAGLIPDASFAVVFACFTALIYVVSGWDESRARPPLTDSQRRVLTSPPEPGEDA